MTYEEMVKAKKQDRSLTGFAKIWSDTDAGVIVPCYDDKNMIVTEGRRKNVHYLGDSSKPANWYVNQAKFGTMGHSGGNTDLPVAPQESNVNLNDPAPVVAALVNRVYLPVGVEISVLFQFRLEMNQGNGAGSKIYTEAGLYTADGLMYARVTFKGHLKDATRRLWLEWTIL